MSVHPSSDDVTKLFRLPPAPPQGRARLIGVAMQLFYEHGINAVGLDRILAEAGVSKTTLYKHFESKTDLVVATLQERGRWESDAWEQAVSIVAGDQPQARILGLMDVLHILFQSPEFNGCQFISAATEFPSPSDPIHRVAAEYKRSARQSVLDLAIKCALVDPDVFADAFTLVFEGALILKQVHLRSDAARVATPIVRQLLQIHSGPATQVR